MTRSADYGWEDSTRSIVTGKASFAHARPIVNHQRCYLIVCHSDCTSCKILLSNRSVKNNSRIFFIIIIILKLEEREIKKEFFLQHQNYNNKTLGYLITYRRVATKYRPTQYPSMLATHRSTTSIIAHKITRRNHNITFYLLTHTRSYELHSREM